MKSLLLYRIQYLYNLTLQASSSKEESQKRAQIALSILQDTQQLLSKGMEEGSDSPLKRVVGKWPLSFFRTCGNRPCLLTWAYQLLFQINFMDLLLTTTRSMALKGELSHSEIQLIEKTYFFTLLHIKWYYISHMLNVIKVKVNSYIVKEGLVGQIPLPQPEAINAIY